MKRQPVVEIFRDKAGNFRFRVMSKNYKIICQSEGYTTKAMCKKSIVSLAAIFAYDPCNWCVRDLTKKAKVEND